jgi:uncharacterized RDD family membrane protein YckC
VNEVELSLVPLEARAYQGRTAGIITRLAANTIDGALVCAALIGTYLGVVAFFFVVSPRAFTWPSPSLFWFVLGFFGMTVVYLTAAWWVSGRTIGDHVMGVRVVTGKRTRLRIGRAFLRAVLCAAFPIGLLWCVVSRDRRAVHDVLLRTSVVYDWLPRPPRTLAGTTTVPPP